jgi:hypothetical protein
MEGKVRLRQRTSSSSSSTGDSTGEKGREETGNGRDSTSTQEERVRAGGGRADCLNMDQGREYPLGDCHSQ